MPEMNHKKSTIPLTSVISLFGLIFMAESITMQFVYSSMDFFSTPLSIYATGELWYVVTSGLMMIATCYFLLALLFLTDAKMRNRETTIGSVILLIVAECTFLLALFRTDIGETVSLRGHIHIIAAHLHFILLPVSVLFLSAGLKEKPWKTYRILSFIFSALLIAAGMTLGCKDLFGLQSYSGVIQKTLIMVIVCWIIYSAQCHAAAIRRLHETKST